MTSPTIAFIGAGNMARSLIGGLITDGYDPKKIWASNRNQEKLTFLVTQYNIQTSTDNIEAVKHADIAVISVKPKMVQTVCEEISQAVSEQQAVVISLAAGLRLPRLAEWLAPQTPIVRAMPNTPAMVGSGATGLIANESVTADHRSHAESIMRAVGLATWVEHEDQLDVLTALSGSGPAYFFLIMEAMIDSATELGLPRDKAQILTLQTCLGAAHLGMQANLSLPELRKQVTSPGGTTEAAIQTLESSGIRDTLHDTLKAAIDRAKGLSTKEQGSSS